LPEKFSDDHLDPLHELLGVGGDLLTRLGEDLILLLLLFPDTSFLVYSQINTLHLWAEILLFLFPDSSENTERTVPCPLSFLSGVGSILFLIFPNTPSFEKFLVDKKIRPCSDYAEILPSQIANPQIHMLFPLSQICTFLSCASSQIPNPQISTNYFTTLSQKSPNGHLFKEMYAIFQNMYYCGSCKSVKKYWLRKSQIHKLQVTKRLCVEIAIH
jgi:hypothetical protein